MTLSFQCLVKLGLLTYYELNISYIIRELCENKDKPDLKCHGKCFLKKKMGLADKAEKQTAEIFKQVEFPVFITPSSQLKFEQFIVINIDKIEIPNLYTYTISTRIFHPPLV